ncbi:mechanosensitive cation channel TMEM63B-like isoform X1 [Lampetra fluviatilis]
MHITAAVLMSGATWLSVAAAAAASGPWVRAPQVLEAGGEPAQESPLVPFVPAPSHPNKSQECFGTLGRSSVLQGTPFGGVVAVLGINFLLWMLLLLLFSVLRKKAWDYGRLALLNDNDRPLVHGRWKNYDFHGGLYEERGARERLDSQYSITDYESKDKGLCSWLTAIFRIKDDEVKYKCGADAVHYLSFQRHIIALLVVASIFSLAIILPVNFSGNLLGNSPTNFGRTTIANLEAGDRLLWLHITFAIVYLLMTVGLMRRHTASLQYAEEELVTRTIFILNIRKDVTDEGKIIEHFQEAYPSCKVNQVQFCYNLSKLVRLDRERKKVAKALKYYDVRPEGETIDPRPCGHLCCCKCCGNHQEVDAVEHYKGLKNSLSAECEKERSKVRSQPLGMAFVTFQDDRTTSDILADYNLLRCWRRPHVSRLSEELGASSWRVRYAPDPNSIIWENLQVQGLMWWCRVFVLNALLFLLLFFLTTPAIIVNTMDKFNVTKPIESLNSPIVTQFLPTLLLWAFSAVLPFLVYYSVFLESHWTRSTENRTTMHKCYFYLIFMVLILPSLGLTSLNVFFRWLFDKDFLEQGSVRFECVFLPDNGAFFVNYVITSAFIGTAMELLRVPGLLLYALRLCWARSKAERKNVKQEQAYEFQFGQAYAWMMSVLTVVMTYSITCPIILLFGLIYILLKHMVDRYNIYYAYMPAKLNRQIHSAAVNQVVAAPILCICWLLFYSVLRLGPRSHITIFTFVVLLLTVTVCIGRSFFGYFKYCSIHINQSASRQPAEDSISNDGVAYAPSSPTYQAAMLLEVINGGRAEEEDEEELGETPDPTGPSYGATDIDAALDAAIQPRVSGVWLLQEDNAVVDGAGDRQ